jgi:hypothetical protein
MGILHNKGVMMMSNYESPDYKVLKSDKNFELRKYDLFYMVEYDNELDPEIVQGFNTLFSYIGSDNEENKKISMTIPVIEEVSDGKMKMAFVLPKKFGCNAPLPKSEHLRIKTFTEGFYAVISYGGRSTTRLEQVNSIQLHEWVKLNHWTIVSKDMLAFYNAPFIPGIFRKNEIMVKVDKVL